MTDAVPVQEFQIGQRVKTGGKKPFVITAVCLDWRKFYYAEFIGLDTWYFSHELTLCPERPPYVASERRIVLHSGECPTFSFTEIVSASYRRETDTELAARHAIERAAYDAQGDEA